MPRFPAQRAPLLALLLGVAACGAHVRAAPGGSVAPPPPPQPPGRPALDTVPVITSISPREGLPGTPVTVAARGFRPGVAVDIGFGPPESEYDVIATVRADAGGRVSAQVRVPQWAEERDYVFVAAGPGDRKAVSGLFRVRTRTRGLTTHPADRGSASAPR